MYTIAAVVPQVSPIPLHPTPYVNLFSLLCSFTLSLLTHTNCNYVAVVTGSTPILSWVSVLLPFMFGILHFSVGMGLS